MFERYTERARRTVFFARYEAAQLGAREIDTEHLLLGLVRESHHLLRFFPMADNLEAIRNTILALTPSREVNSSPDIPLTTAAKRTLTYAMEEADSLGHPNIGTEHLFLGLLREPDTMAGKVCAKHGAELVKARQLIMSSDEGTPAPTRITAPARHQAEGCVVFIEANSGERVGITGMYGLDKVPREGEFVTLEDYRRKPRRFRVVEVVYHFHREPANAPASAHQLSSITIRVLQIAAHAGGALSDST